MTFKDLKVKVYADGAVIADMKKAYESGYVKGFTTNPSLMKAAGIKDYFGFAKEAMDALPGMPISFEVFSDDTATMEVEAEKLYNFGKENGFSDRLYIKVPILTTKGESTAPLIEKLSKKGYNLNITAILTVDQARETVNAFAPNTNNLVSVFAGRIADTGRDAMPIMHACRELCNEKPGTELLWASNRQVFDVIQADQSGCDIITCTPAIISKLGSLDKDLYEVSLDTVKAFAKDIEALGISL